MYNYTTDKEKDSFNFFNVRRELDYSICDKDSIDDRVLQVVKDAEKNFMDNQRAVKEIEKLKITDFKFKNNRINLNLSHKRRIYEPTDFTQVNFNNYEYLNDNNNKNYNNERNLNSNSQIKQNLMNSSNGIKFLQNTNKSFNYNERNIKNNSSRSFSNGFRLTNMKENFYNSNDKFFNSGNKNNKIENYKIPIKHKHLKSGKKCIACELKKRIQNKGEIEHVDHIKFKLNCDTNKLLLNTKSQMKKLNFKKAYEMLKLPLSQGIYHSDIFYLFGEICRILKKLEESEKYLLECLKFEQHSPFVLYSLGLLYQELMQYKYSVSFFKHFIQILETADGHYQLAKSYIGLKKYLKAAINITKAIQMNKNSIEYFEFRGSLYEMMGFKELAIEDREFIRNLTKVD